MFTGTQKKHAGSTVLLSQSRTSCWCRWAWAQSLAIAKCELFYELMMWGRNCGFVNRIQKDLGEKKRTYF